MIKFPKYRTTNNHVTYYCLKSFPRIWNNTLEIPTLIENMQIEIHIIPIHNNLDSILYLLEK